MADDRAATVPNDNIEETIATIWSQILGAEDIKAEDNFVALGGDSIGAALCRNMVIRTLGVEVSLDMFLETEMTLRNLSAIITKSLAPGGKTSTPDGR